MIDKKKLSKKGRLLRDFKKVLVEMKRIAAEMETLNEEDKAWLDSKVNPLLKELEDE